jgi:putative phosphoesterase
MKIGLISDTHGSETMFRKVMDGPFRDVEMILHAGDLFYHGLRNPFASGHAFMSLATVLNELSIPLIIAKGNCDSDADQLVLRVPIQSPHVFLQVGGKGILLLHGDGKRDADLEELIKRFDLSFLIHGHSHLPRIKRADKGLIINPGTLSRPSPSGPRRKSVGLLDTEQGKVVIRDIENDDVLFEETL